MSHLQNGGKCQPKAKPWRDKAMEDASRTLLGGTLIWAGSRLKASENIMLFQPKPPPGDRRPKVLA